MPKRLRRLAVLFPDTHPANRTMLTAIGEGFAQQGVEVFGGLGLRDEERLVGFLRETRPDAVFDVNRCRDQIPFLPRTIRHICWMIDAGNRPLAEIRGSELTYFFGANWLRQYPHRHEAQVGWLPPGFCPRSYRPGLLPLRCDLLFAGHIPRPWTEAERARPVFRQGQREIVFGQLVDLVDRAWDGANHANFANDQYFEWALSLLDQAEDIRLDRRQAQPLFYDIACRLMRGLGRRRLLDLAVASQRSLVLYGSENFRLYPAYAPAYQRFVETAAELAALYQSAGLTLHDGVGVHFRTFDCMGAGGLICYARSPDDDVFGGINTCFEPDLHYVSVTPQTFSDQVERYLSDEGARRRLADAAARRVHRDHTWAKRTEQILADLDRL
jgi:Glycosyl transferases group 1